MLWLVYYYPRNLEFDIRTLSALIIRGVEPGITRTCSGVYKGYILIILRVCSGPQQTRSFSSEFTTKRTAVQFDNYSLGIGLLIPSST